MTNDTGSMCVICDHIEEMHKIMGASHPFTPKVGPKICSECGWEVSQGSHADDCSHRVLMRAAGWLAAPEGESRQATIDLIQALVDCVKNVTGRESVSHGPPVAVLEAVPNANGPAGRAKGEDAAGGQPGVGAIPRPGTEIRAVKGLGPPCSQTCGCEPGTCKLY